MTNNPAVTLRSQAGTKPAHALTAHRPDSKEMFFGKNPSGKIELNASSRQDLMGQLLALANGLQAGEVTLSKNPNENRDRHAVVAEQKQVLATAFHDKTPGGKWATLGAQIGAQISETSDRDGFARRLFIKGDVAEGTHPRIRVRWKNTTALVAASASMNEPIWVRDKYLYPPEFYITANVRIEEREVHQGSGDIMEDAYFNTMEQITVEEDRHWKSLADDSVGIVNSLQVLAGGLTPTSLSAMRNEVDRWGIPPMWMVMATDFWTDIVGNAAVWGNLLDPVSQFEIIQTGYLGTLLGMGIMSDAYRYPQTKVLEQGEIYIVGAAEQHGVYTERGPVVAHPVDSYPEGAPGRGWYFHEVVSFTLANARSVSKGVKA